MSTLDAIQARADAATAGPWRALGTGTANGDHWYVCDDGEAIASISSQDGINEDQREPDAVFIAHAREDVPLLAGVIRGVEALHWVQHHNNKPSTCHADGKHYPCPTVVKIRAALG